MLKVLILGTTLRDTVGESELELDLSEPTPVKKCLEGHPELNGLLPFMHRGELLVTVNKKVSTLDSTVKDGDILKLAHQSNPVYEGARWHNP